MNTAGSVNEWSSTHSFDIAKSNESGSVASPRSQPASSGSPAISHGSSPKVRISFSNVQANRSALPMQNAGELVQENWRR